MAKKSTPVRKSKFLKTSQQLALKKKTLGYDGALRSRNRLNRSFLTTYSVDEDNLIGAYQAERLRLESKDLFRNGIGKACVDRFTTYVIGTGFNVQAKTSDKIINTKYEKWFKNWTKIADVTKRRTWLEILQTIVRDRLLVGESFFILTDNGFLQPIEAERICSPEPIIDFKDKTIVQGVELLNGIIQAYYVCDRGIGGQVDKTKYTRVQARDMIHISACWRWDAVRSLAELAPILDVLRDKSEYTTSTIISAKLAARKSLVITSENDMPTLPSRETTPSSTDDDAISDRRTRILPIEDGEITYASPGDKVETVKQEVPGTTYSEFTKSILGEVAAILGISYEILMLEFSRADIAGAGIGIKVASQVFAIWQQWISDKFIERVYIWRIAKAIKAGDLPSAPLDDNGISEWYKINILPPIDVFQVDQVSNDIQAFNLGSVSLTQIAKRQSTEAEDLLQEKCDDIGTAIELAQALNKKYKGQNIVWRDIINSTGPASLASSQINADQAALNKNNTVPTGN